MLASSPRPTVTCTKLPNIAHRPAPRDQLIRQGIHPHPGPFNVGLHDASPTDSACNPVSFNSKEHYTTQHCQAMPTAAGSDDPKIEPDQTASPKTIESRVVNAHGLRIRLINMRSGARFKADWIHQNNCDVAVLTEIDVPEYAVWDVSNTLRDSNWDIIFGCPTNISATNDRFFGRRVAIAFRNEIGAESANHDDEPNATTLDQSGRWVEVTIPTCDGRNAINVAAFYGISGASSNSVAYTANERLLAAACVRLVGSDVPYYICTDANVTACRSDTVNTLIQDGSLIDVFGDRCDDERGPPPTYQKHGIQTPNVEHCTPNTSRIDYMLCNHPANALVQEARYLGHCAVQNALDHIPLQITLCHTYYDLSYNTSVPPRPISVEHINRIDQRSKDKLFDAVTDLLHGELDRAIAHSDVTAAHAAWSYISEAFLICANGHDLGCDISETISGLHERIPLLFQHGDKFSRRGVPYAEHSKGKQCTTVRGFLQARNATIAHLDSFRRRLQELVTKLRRLGDQAAHDAQTLRLIAKIRGDVDRIEPLDDNDNVGGSFQNADLTNIQDAKTLSQTATKLLHHHTKERQKSRLQTLRDKLFGDWRKTGLRAFFRHIKNDSKLPRSSFRDPTDGDRYTSDPKRIDNLFRQCWGKIFNRSETEAPPNWHSFYDDYHKYITPITITRTDAPTAEELAHQAKRVSPHAAAGSDSWRPAELRALPKRAWVLRERVEKLIIENQVYPSVYYEVPITALRKGEGYTPVDHRGISIYVANYRLSAAVWWSRLCPGLAEWTHPTAYGGLPGRECAEAAWDAQAAFEQAILTRTPLTQTNLDYWKFFDTFDPHFFRQLKISVGIPRPLAELNFHLNSNVRKRFKIRHHLGEFFQINRGAGQGDSFSLLDALVITTVQARLIADLHSDVTFTSVVDDRAIRGPCKSVIAAVHTAMKFDRAAGLHNATKKFVGLATTAEDRETLRRTIFDGQVLRVELDTTHVGFNVTTRRAPKRILQDSRVQTAMKTASRIISSHAPDFLAAIAVASACIPKMAYGAAWTTPSLSKLRQLRSKALAAMWGKCRLMRCAEVVVGLLNDPTRVDPTGALIFHALTELRRLLRKSDARASTFIANLWLADDVNLENVQGPVHAFLSYVGALDCTYHTEGNQIIITCTDNTQNPINLLDDDASHVKTWLRRRIKYIIINGLAQRVQCSDGDAGHKPDRKDMVGITAYVDEHATLAGHNRSKSKQSDHHINAETWRRHARTIIAGATRYGDRLKAGKITDSDVCPHPGCGGARCDAEHWYYHCCANPHASGLSAATIQDIIDEAEFSSMPCRGRELKQLFAKPCLRLCGICPDPYPAIRPTQTTKAHATADLSRLYNTASDPDSAIDFDQLVTAGVLPRDHNRPRVRLYTDGSCALPRHHALAHAGWGFAFHESCSLNAWGPVCGPVQTSFRAEVRAIAQAVARLKVPCEIISDCRAVVDLIHRFQLTQRCADDDDPAAQLLNFIFRIIKQAPEEHFKFRWMPSHLDSKHRADKRRSALSEGLVDLHDIQGNVAADIAAAAGARAHAIGPHVTIRADDRARLTSAIQNHLVLSWDHWIKVTRGRCHDHNAEASANVDAGADAPPHTDDYEDSTAFPHVDDDNLPTATSQPNHGEFYEDDLGDWPGIDFDGNEIPSHVNTPHIDTAATATAAASKTPRPDVLPVRPTYTDDNDARKSVAELVNAKTFSLRLSAKSILNAFPAVNWEQINDAGEHITYANTVDPFAPLPRQCNYENWWAMHWWLQSTPFSRHWSHTSGRHSISDAQASYFEVAISFMLDTGIEPAGHGADLVAHTNATRQLFVSVARKCGFIEGGQKYTCQAFFSPKQSTQGGIVFAGSRFPGICRRPRWLHGLDADLLIAVNLLRARQHAKVNNTNFGSGYHCVFGGLPRGQLWRPPALINFLALHAEAKRKHQQSNKPPHWGKQQRLLKAASAHDQHEKKITMPTSHSATGSADPVPTNQTSYDSCTSRQCHFGHKVNKRAYKQDLVPNWRGATLGAPLCYTCHWKLLHELQDTRIPLVTDSDTTCLNEMRPHGSFLEHGPCHYGHQWTSGQRADGSPTWHWHAHKNSKLGIPAHSTLCTACWRRAKRGYAPDHMRTTAHDANKLPQLSTTPAQQQRQMRLTARARPIDGRKRINPDNGHEGQGKLTKRTCTTRPPDRGTLHPPSSCE